MTQLKSDGTFITLSQYLEDLTRYNSEGESYQISPSSYKCFNCNFVGLTDEDILQKIKEFEDQIIAEKQSEGGYNYTTFKGKFNDHFTFLPEKPVYGDDIDIKSHNLHNGIGYTEIYCHIPENLIINEPEKFEEIEGDSITFNAIVVYYDVIDLQPENIETIVEKIPMGIYFTGRIANGVMSNSVTKHNFTSNSTSNSTSSGSSYGLKICSRYVLGQEAQINFSSDVEYDNLSYVLSKMSETQESIQRVVETMVTNNEQYKSLLSIFKNSRTNVPYIKKVNVLDQNGILREENHWFVNGKDLGVTVQETE